MTSAALLYIYHVAKWKYIVKGVRSPVQYASVYDSSGAVFTSLASCPEELGGAGLVRKREEAYDAYPGRARPLRATLTSN